MSRGDSWERNGRKRTGRSLGSEHRERRGDCYRATRSETGSGSRDWEQVDGGRGTEMETETKNAGRESRQGNQ